MIEEQAEMVTVSGLWEKTDINGHNFLNGAIGQVAIYIFDNPRAGEFGQPSYLLKIGQKPKKRLDKDPDGNY